MCGEAEVEEDPKKLQKLAEQITRILDEEQARLRSLQVNAGKKIPESLNTRPLGSKNLFPSFGSV